MSIVVASILAMAFVSLMIPQVNLFFFLPQRIRIQSASADLLDALFEGDNNARGLRYAGPAAGSSAITAANANSLTYAYRGVDGVNHTITLTYNAVSHTVTRAVDGGPAKNIPYYVTSGSGILVAAAETNFFRYYNVSGVEFSPALLTLSNIYRVDVATRVNSGSGKVTESEGNILMKSGVEIKHYVTEAPDI